LLRLDLVLVVIPGADRGINKAAKKEQEADEQYDAGHPSVKSMSFVHTRGLTHCAFPGHTLLGDTDIKAQREDRVNSAECKLRSTFTLIIVIKNDSNIYCIDNHKKNNQKSRNKTAFG